MGKLLVSKRNGINKCPRYSSVTSECRNTVGNFYSNSKTEDQVELDRYIRDISFQTLYAYEAICLGCKLHIKIGDLFFIYILSLWFFFQLFSTTIRLQHFLNITSFWISQYKGIVNHPLRLMHSENDFYAINSNNYSYRIW